MSAARDIPRDVRNVQIDAANPDVSAFVSANAGSGKTHVLAQRVINLLLRGVDPAKILCITFTKAAAANMANRVFGRLAAWTALDDKALDEQIRLSTGAKPEAAQRARARRLFASALETPGGLKVQTIHAFCTRLLHQFPFEANVAARFHRAGRGRDHATARAADARRAAGSQRRARRRTWKGAGDGHRGRRRRDLQGGDRRRHQAARRHCHLDRACRKHRQGHRRPVEELRPCTRRQPGKDRRRNSCQLRAFPKRNGRRSSSSFGTGSTNDQKHIAALEAARGASGRDRIKQYLKVFCTAERKPRKTIVTKKIADKHPDWLARLQDEQTRVCALLDRERALHARERTRALVTIAKAVIDRYQAEKDRRGLLDYDDLIDKTLPLLSDGSAAWVHYKLDLGIDHMLIDEAQDTSPKQWEIIRQLASEFVSGGSRPDVRRTIFAVGDEKQSIFSFQGAAPAAFDEMRRYFARQFDTPELGWRYLRFHHSFRSGEAVLGSVDQVFKTREIYESVTTDVAGIPEHLALPEAAPGLVELWPLLEPAEKKEIEGWDAPFDTESERSPRVQLAQRIAKHVKLWTARGLSPGEVLVLVRQRGPLFEAIIRALKDADVPVAGADRLVLTEHIAVMDLMVLADALLLEEDDLALASVLKSPLFGLTEEQLFELAWNRKGSLRNALGAKTSDALFGAVEAELQALSKAARGLSPFGFFADVLGPRHGRKKFLARLGPEANDALDEFLNFALDYETRETPSLQGFLAWLRAAKSEVKRDMELSRDEVRVMTVHGAKGLEAETVILADTTTEPKGAHPPKLLALADGALVWATRQQDDTEAMTAAREGANVAARDEYRRLLYVAMTRAKERLVICGAKGEKKIPDGCWYQLADDALRGDCVSEPADDGDGAVLRFRKAPVPPVPTEAKRMPAAKKQTLPSWLTSDAPVERPAMPSVTPSSAIDDVAARPLAVGGASAARLRGSLAHRLLQALPDIPADRRAQAAADYLARAGAKLPAEDRSSLAEEVMRVLDDQRFHELYGAHSRAEVPIVGRIQIGGKTVRVSGQIDRLAVTQTSVLIGDFKTNRPAPRRIEEVPPAYVTQLALYRAVLAKLYPGKPVRAALIWTEVPDLMELSAETLDAALAQATPA